MGIFIAHEHRHKQSSARILLFRLPCVQCCQKQPTFDIEYLRALSSVFPLYSTRGS
jgi:hypothetical protein